MRAHAWRWQGQVGQAHFVALPPPSADEVAIVLRRLRHQLAKDFEGLGEQWPEDGLEALWAVGVQHLAAARR